MHNFFCIKNDFHNTFTIFLYTHRSHLTMLLFCSLSACLLFYSLSLARFENTLLKQTNRGAKNLFNKKSTKKVVKRQKIRNHHQMKVTHIKNGLTDQESNCTVITIFFQILIHSFLVETHQPSQPKTHAF